MVIRLTLLKPHELNDLLTHLFSYLGYKNRINNCYSLPADSPTFKKASGFPVLQLTILLLKCPNIMQIFAQLPSFSSTLEALLTIKSPTAKDLAGPLPTVWWQNAEEEVKSSLVAADVRSFVRKRNLNRLLSSCASCT